MSSTTYTIDSETGALIKINGVCFASQDSTYYNTFVATSSPSNWVTVCLNVSGSSTVINEDLQDLSSAPEDNSTLNLNTTNLAYFGSMKDVHPTTIASGNSTQLVVGGAGNDVITGAPHPEVLIGGTGNDTLTGGNSGGNILYA